MDCFGPVLTRLVACHFVEILRGSHRPQTTREGMPALMLSLPSCKKPWMKSSCVLITSLLILLASLSASQPSLASATKIRSCSSGHYVRFKLFGVATVVSASGVTCERARRTVRRFGRAATKDQGTSVTGGRFRLGRFHCLTYYAVEEQRRADCREGERRFWVDYGS